MQRIVDRADGTERRVRRTAGLAALLLCIANVIGGCSKEQALSSMTDGSGTETTQDPVSADSYVPKDTEVADEWPAAVSADAAPGDGAGTAQDFCPSGAGCPCSNGGDCMSGICLNSPFLKECAKNCTVATCRDDQVCSNWGTDLVHQLCLERWPVLCLPCITDGDCLLVEYDLGAACLDYGSMGSFCGESCTDASDCPVDYQCIEDMDPPPGQKPKRQCAHPNPEACACERHVEGLKSLTVCTYANAAKESCLGVRSCGAGGLTPCNKAPFTAEVCQ